jgi:GDP-L-fucose synthase
MTMNVGLGHDYSINEYYQAAAHVMGYSGSFVHDLTKPVGMMRKLVDVDLQQSWGWKAEQTLRSGIEKTYEFYLKDVNK